MTYWGRGGTAGGSGGFSTSGGFASGGKPGIGGSAITGGSPGNGGNLSRGGSPSTGGTVATGGTSTGGSTATAGAGGSSGKNWYVDAQNGSDDWPGTSAQPFKSLTRASQAAVSNDTLYLLDGTWDSTTDPKLQDLGIAFAPNVKLRAVNPGAARIQASGNHGLSVKGGLIEGIRFVCQPGRPVIETGAGALEIVGSSLQNCTSAGLDLTGTAQVTVRTGNLADYSEGENGSLAIARDQSSLTIEGGRLSYMNRAVQLEGTATLALHGVTMGGPTPSGRAGAAIFWLNASPHVVIDGGSVIERASMAVQGTGPSFDVHIDNVTATDLDTAFWLSQNAKAGTANVSVNRFDMSNCTGPGVLLSNQGVATLSVTNSHFANIGGPAIMPSGPGNVTIESVTVTGGWGGVVFQTDLDRCGMAVKVRNLSATGGDYEGMRIVCCAEDTYDFGTVSSPGNNVISGNNRSASREFSNLTFAVPANVTLYAVGNTWDANEQGADANGHYSVPAASTSKKLDLTTGSGKNFMSWEANAGRLRLAEVP
jgi:hypothetical protein